MQLTKREDVIAMMIGAQTHPDQEFVKWFEDPEKDTNPIVQSLLKKGVIAEKEGQYQLTKLGNDYMKRPFDELSAKDILKRLEKMIPKNPSFQSIAEGLTDTALIRAFYVILGEVGRRGNPDVPASYDYWLQKCKDFELALKDAEPNALWEKHQPK